jgi:hypothetical protein
MHDLLLTGPVGSRRHVLEKTCQESHGHLHNYDHVTVVVLGGIRVTIYREKDGPVESQQDYFPGSDPIPIANHKYHTIKALADNTVYHCIFSHRDFDGLVTQTYQGNVTAYV